jgi:hypothetical protein
VSRPPAGAAAPLERLEGAEEVLALRVIARALFAA